MSIYNQPLESLSEFNTKMFNQPDDTISPAEASLLYLSKVNSDTSTAPITTFNGNIYFNNGSRYYDTTNYTEFAQVANQLTIKPVSLNGSLALFSSASGTGLPVQQLLINNAGLTANGVTAADFDTSNPTSLTRICNSTTSGTIRLGAGLNSSGNLEIGSNTGNNTIKGPTTFNNAVTIGGNTILNQTTITDGQNFNARQILSSNTGASIAHSIFTNMGGGSSLTIGNNNSTNVQVNSILIANSGFTMKQNSSCEAIFSVNTIGLQATAGTKNFWTAAAATTTLNIGNILAPLNLNASTFTIAGTTAVFNSSVSCNNGLTANVATAGDYDTQNTTGLCRICNSTSSGTIRLGAGLNSSGNLEIGSNTGNNTIKGLTTFSQNTIFQNTGTTTINGVLAINENATFATLKTTTFNGTTIFNGTNTFNTGATSFPARMILRGGQYANEVFDTGINTSYTLGSLPIQQRIIISTTTNINITLPTITNSSHAGLEFTFIKTGSITNSVTFTRGGTNLIYSSSTITNVSPYTTLVNTQTTIVFIILEVSAGVFVWKEIV